MGDGMKQTNSVLGRVKFAASGSGSKFVIGREGWKGWKRLLVKTLMYVWPPN